MAEQDIKVGLKYDDKVSGGFKKSTENIERDAKKMAGSFGKLETAVKSFVGVYLGIQGLRLATDFMKQATKAASNLEESHAKAMTVFEGHEKTLTKTTDELTKSYAMSRREAYQNLAAVQDLLVPLGMAKGAAADMSGEIVKLSADLGSFNNLPTEQVMLDIQSALVGNFETMKKYGVVLNETVLKEEARARGLYSGKGLVDAQTKAQVAYELVVKSSQAAIGDMERTSDGWANTMKKLGSRWEDFIAGIGSFIIESPLMHSAIETTISLLEDLTDLLTDGLTPQERELVEIEKQLAEERKKLGRESQNLSKDIQEVSTQNYTLADAADFSFKSMSKLTDETIRQSFSVVSATSDVNNYIGQSNKLVESLELRKEKLLELIEKQKEDDKDSGNRGKKKKEDDESFIKDFEKNFQKEKKADEAKAKDKRKFADDTMALNIAVGKAEKKRVDDSIAAHKAYTTAVMFGTAQMLGALSGLSAQNKESAELTKVLARGEVAISTAAAIMKGYRQGGPLLGTIYAIGLAAEGLRQLSVINTTKFGRGGNFTTSGPQMIMVGDNPGGVEHVAITPLSSPNVNGPQSNSINMGDIIINGNTDAGTVAGIRQTREKNLRDLREMLTELTFARQMPKIA